MEKSLSVLVLPPPPFRLDSHPHAPILVPETEMHSAQSQDGRQTEGRTEFVQDAEPNPAPPDGTNGQVPLQESPAPSESQASLEERLTQVEQGLARTNTTVVRQAPRRATREWLTGIATLFALGLTLALYYETARFAAKAAEDTEQTLALLGRQLLGDSAKPEPVCDVRGLAAFGHVTVGLMLANCGDALTDTSPEYRRLHQMALDRYDSALAGKLYMGQHNTILTNSHRWWARLKLGKPDERIRKAGPPWWAWAIFFCLLK